TMRSNNSTVLGNYIGVASDGTTALGNHGNGVEIDQYGGTNNTIGLPPPVTGPLSASKSAVSASKSPASVSKSSASASKTASAASVGAAAPFGNVIADNTGDGVYVDFGSSNAILANSIYGNGNLGIELAADTNNGITPPTLTSATPSGTAANTTVISGSLTVPIISSSPASPATVEFFASDSCDSGGSGPGQTYLGDYSVNTDSNGNATFTANVPASVPLTSVVTATVTDSQNDTSQFSTCLTPVVPNDSWTRAKTLTLTGTSNPLVMETTAQQAILSQGESLWYKVQIQPGSTVAVTLTNLPASYELALYKDISQAYQNYNTPTDLEHLSQEFAPDAFSPDAFSPDAFSPDAFSPDAFSPDAFSPDAFSPDAFSPDAFSPDTAVGDPAAFTGAQLQSLLAVSAYPGDASQGVLVRTWENTGDFYIRVRGQNGVFDPSKDFTLTVIQQNLNCGSLQQVTTPTSLKATAGNYKTLVLTDFSRLPGSSTDQATLKQLLSQFTARPEVQGTVVDVSADARVADANAKADSNISCPIAKDYVADSIEDIIQEYQAANPGLQYVVVLGGDNVIPFYRYPDEALLANEDGFSPPVSDSSSSQASLKDGYVLTEDVYGAGTTLSLQANQFPVAGLAVGRLVETASEISGMLSAYMSTSGGVVPITHPSLVTGYDFMQPSASQIGSILQDASGQTTSSLLEMNGKPPTDPSAWTASDLETAFLGSRHDLVYLAGHFSAGSALAADYQTRMLTTDVTSSALNMVNEIIISAGCHSGYNTVNSDGIPTVTWEPDWPEAFAEKQATLIAGTGYQYGDTDLTKYSDLLYVDFAKELAGGTAGTPVTLGQALVNAKQYYLANTPQLDGINQKSVLEATLYGLPMLAVNLPNRTPLPTPTSFATPSLATTNPGSTLGLSSQDITVGQSLTNNSKQLTDPTTNTQYVANYLTASNVTVNGQGNLATTDTMTSPTEPVLPMVVLNANPTNNPNSPGTAPVLRGVGFFGGTYTDTAGVLPLTSAPATELSASHATFQANVFYPVVPWSVNYLDPLTSGGAGATRL
ncbi:MAG TPA: right-handed parallel beta-helix repeat-containing protein, partial [Thermomicrobiaceae bacterium]|nr:right-handed parallel beta-helix repeat-containing protein [Thermomicrobiaceae bacterium]